MDLNWLNSAFSVYEFGYGFKPNNLSGIFGIVLDTRFCFGGRSKSNEYRLGSIESVQEDEVYAAIGQDGFRRLAGAFYRQIPADEVLGPMYSGRDLVAAEERLRNFLIFRFGGPPLYIEDRGHPRLRMRHFPFAIDEGAKDRWLTLMNRAFEEARLDPQAEAVLRGFFESTAGFLINRPG